MEHTHFHPASKTWFTPETCETCGGPIQAPNAVQLFNPENVPGLIYVAVLPVEGAFDETTGKEVCESCW